MLLQILDPSPFYGECDEEHFFDWLENISAVKCILQTPNGVDLTISVPIDRTSFYELFGVMTRYQLDRKPLRQLCEGHQDAWFNDTTKPWYASVFESSFL